MYAHARTELAVRRRTAAWRIGTPVLLLALAATATALACDGDPTEPKPRSLEITPSADYFGLETGETMQLSAVVRDRRGEAITGAPVSWSSTRPERISVDSTGFLRAAPSYLAVCRELRVPHCSIYVMAQAEAVADTQWVLLYPPTAIVELLPSDTTIAVGDSVQIRASVTVEGQQWGHCSDLRVHSSDPSVASLSYNWMVTGLAAGQTRVEGRVVNTYCNSWQGDSMTVTVVP